MFIANELTPNPNAIKFLPGREISPKSPGIFNKLEDCSTSTLAHKLLMIDNVEMVFFGQDFITVTKAEEGEWQMLKPQILMTIMDHFVLGLEVYDRKEGHSSYTENKAPIGDIEKQIIAVIEDYIRPAVMMDGGDVIYRGFEKGVVKLILSGACHGCPSSSITLKQGIEGTLKYHVPEVTSVEMADEKSL